MFSVKVRKTIIVLLCCLSVFSARAQSVGLVLSGGGAKGLSHIGVIKALEENNIPIDYISGTSMGAIIGGLYSIGLTPDEMLSILRSDAFLSWYKGIPEKDYESFLFQETPTAELFRINVGWKPVKKENGIQTGTKNPPEGKDDFRLKISLPTSVVSPYPMDVAVMQLFGSSAAAAGYDFNNLMVPFFCVAADVAKKTPFVISSGDLGSAIRSSMTFPGYFKPIVIDSTLLFDGGFYNNFPWELMEEKFHPDVLIGAKCVKGESAAPEEDDPVGMLELMMTTDTDYSVPEDKGLVIAGIYDYAIMDFDKVDEIVKLGYENALKYIPELKKRIKAERSAEEMNARRLDFRKKCSELRFNKIVIEGDFKEGEREYLARTISDDRDTFDFSQAKRGYYRVVSSNTVNTLYPTAIVNSDSLFTLNVRASKKNIFSFGIGGNISSSSLTQVYLGANHVHLAKNPIRTSWNFNIGQYYSGTDLSIRQDFSVNPMVYYTAEVVAHRFDYFTSSQSIIFSNALSSNIREDEVFGSLTFGMPLSKRYGMLMNIGATMGKNYYNYYPTKAYSKYDVQDKSKVFYFSPRFTIVQNTHNYKQFPTDGKLRRLDFRYIYSRESFVPGTLTNENKAVDGVDRNTFVLDLLLDNYYSFAKWFSFGFSANLVVSSAIDLADYTSTILMMPAYTPTVHSRTLLLEKYRAPIFAGVSVSPIFKVTPSILVHTTIGYFQPYQSIIQLADGAYEYEEPLKMGSFLANVSLVWQAPFGPVSLACSYYNDAETKWYPQFNIGFLIFHPRALRN